MVGNLQKKDRQPNATYGAMERLFLYVMECVAISLLCRQVSGNRHFQNRRKQILDGEQKRYYLTLPLIRAMKSDAIR